MENYIIDAEILEAKLQKANVTNLEAVSIRDIVKVVNLLEAETKIPFVRMEMGVPGTPPTKIGTEAEIAALREGVAHVYPMLEGIPELSTEATKFVKNFMDIDVQPAHFIPTVGAMQATYSAFMALTECHHEKDTILFIDPNFPAQKTQVKVIGKKYVTFDIFSYRGEKLRDKIESYLKGGNICALVYSNPNNPTWTCLTDDELRMIGELADRYDVVVVEDLAYFGMDLRNDISHPGVPPYQPTVAKYTDSYILVLSASKIFSYAGQRIGMLCVSDTLWCRKYPDLLKRYGSEEMGYTLGYRLVYTQSSGTAHSPQYAIAAILKAANEGKLDIQENIREYGARAKEMKRIFLDAGFKIVYDRDSYAAIGDGFYFTIGFSGLTGGQLAKELMYYGISSYPLKGCGSEEAGLRACVSQIDAGKMALLKERVERFKKDHSRG